MKRWLGILLMLAAGCGKSEERVVLYCAQDQEFAEGILREFTARTGLKVAPKYDTEADKSVSLYVELVSEKDRPRCDVHWNNEILATIRLERQGMLEPYSSPSLEGLDAPFRGKHGTWTGFAGRARILIVNTQLVPEADWPRSLFDLAEPRWRGRVAMSKPQFGTSATQAACLFEVLGQDRAKEYYRKLRDNGVHVVAGNKQVAEGVAAGQFAFGVTDTDDAMEELSAGRPVAIVFPDRAAPANERLGTLFIPNTVALIRGSPNPGGGRKLIDFLLSEEVEGKLAETSSHQIPLIHRGLRSRLPKAIETPETVKKMDVDFYRAADLWDEAQAFLRQEFARP